MKDNNYFFKIYTNNLKILRKLTKREFQIFLDFCVRMDYANGEVDLTPSYRKFLAEVMRVKLKTMYNIISSLVKKGVVIKNDGKYYVNNKIAQKGGSK